MIEVLRGCRGSKKSKNDIVISFDYTKCLKKLKQKSGKFSKKVENDQKSGISHFLVEL